MTKILFLLAELAITLAGVAAIPLFIALALIAGGVL